MVSYVNVINIHTRVPISAFARVNEWDHPKPLWIAFLILMSFGMQKGPPRCGVLLEVIGIQS